jgi:hypothetical protein
LNIIQLLLQAAGDAINKARNCYKKKTTDEEEEKKDEIHILKCRANRPKLLVDLKSSSLDDA